MRGDADEFMDAGPGKRPGRGPFKNRPECGESFLVEWSISPMREDQKVGVNGDHVPCP